MISTATVALDWQAGRSGARRAGSHAWSPRELFARHGRPLEFKRHKNVYVAGEPADHVYWVCWGEVSLVRNAADGREFTVDHCGQGGVFGEGEVLLDTARQATATCRTDAALLALPRDAALARGNPAPEFAEWLNRSLAASLLRMQERTETLLFKSAQGKVAQALVDLMRDHGRATGEGILIDQATTHQEIGSRVGCARETVSYAFIDFRAQGLIATRNRRTIVRDVNRLRQIAAE